MKKNRNTERSKHRKHKIQNAKKDKKRQKVWPEGPKVHYVQKVPAQRALRLKYDNYRPEGPLWNGPILFRKNEKLQTF
jgi:hypothetical protein